MKIKIILNKDIPRVGQRGQILEVSRIYAENVLMKNNNASIATPAIIAEHNKRQELLQNKKREDNEQHNKTFQELSQTGIEIKRKVDKSNHLYSKIKPQDIIDYIFNKYKISINPKQVLLESEINSIGQYNIHLQNQDKKYNITLTISA